MTIQTSVQKQQKILDKPDIQEDTEPKKPPLYKILLLNDDFTPMDFVINILQRFFHKNHQEAMRITLQVHHEGSGLCGIYTYEVAETKVHEVRCFSKQHQHPLQCILEKE